MTARDYFQLVQQAISASPLVIASNLGFNEVDTNECYIRGVLTLVGGLQLHVAEYVQTAPVFERAKYRYHLQESDGTLLARWDNVPHHRQVSTFPHHRHDANGDIHDSIAMDIPRVMKAIVPFIGTAAGS